MKALLGVLALWAGMGAVASAQPLDRRAEIETALAAVGGYVSTVLITQSGMGRADYDLVSGQWLEYEPHWHTGQQIWGLVEAHRILGKPELLAAARRGGDWWIGTEFQKPHPLAGLVNAYHGDSIGKLINFTTISDGTPGLFALTRATGDARYADAAARSGRYLWAATRVPDAIPGGAGLFYNFIDPDTAQVLKDRSPHHPKSIPAKITQTARPNIEGYLFKDMCLHSRETVWCDRFIAQARAALARQGEDGLWMEFEPNDPDTGKVHPRFNIWNAEALLEAYGLTKDRAFLEGAARTARFMAKVQTSDGRIYYDLQRDGTYSLASITGSATAFAGILWLRLRDHGYAEFEQPYQRSLAWILANRFPETHPDPNLAGAVLETRVRNIQGKARIAIRDIASAFSLRFLAMAHDDLNGADVNQSHRKVPK